MDIEQVLTVVGWFIYAGLAGLAGWGWLCVFLVHRQVGRRQFRSDTAASEFQSKLEDSLTRRKIEEVNSLCSEPEYWSKAVPTLIRGAFQKRRLPAAKLRQKLAARFERDILTTIDNTMASINTAIKSAPMLGLLGTVVGMIGAFSRIAGVEHPNPGELAGDINVALYTTAIGLIVAIPLVIAANFVTVRIRKLEDSTAEQMQDFFEILESSLEAPSAQPKKSRVRTN